MDTEYIAKKLFQCKELVKNSTSEDQKKIYQGYLEFWQEKAKNIKIHSKIPIKEALKEAEKPEPIEVETSEPETMGDNWKGLNKMIDAIPQWTAEEELVKAEEFEATYPNKHAYLRRNGEVLKTKAFKEFLNPSTVE